MYIQEYEDVPVREPKVGDKVRATTDTKTGNKKGSIETITKVNGNSVWISNTNDHSWELDLTWELVQEIKVGQVWRNNVHKTTITITKVDRKSTTNPIGVNKGALVSERYVRDNYTLEQDTEEFDIPKVVPTCSKEPTKQTNKENTMNTEKEELELELVKRQIAQLPEVKKAKTKRVKTDLESRGKFVASVYDDEGKYCYMKPFKSMKKAEKFRIWVLSQKEAYGGTVVIHKEVDAYTTLAPIVKVK